MLQRKTKRKRRKKTGLFIVHVITLFRTNLLEFKNFIQALLNAFASYLHLLEFNFLVDL